MDLHQVGYWLLATAVLIGLALLSRLRPAAEQLAARELGRLGRWLLERLRPEPQVDQRAQDLYRAGRRERLLRDLDRLRRLLLTDMGMSATKQLGNRLAYDWVQRELDELRASWPAGSSVDPDHGWSLSAQSVSAAGLRSSYRPSRPPEVEVLDIGWRR
jgi:hypothetical protein